MPAAAAPPDKTMTVRHTAILRHAWHPRENIAVIENRMLNAFAAPDNAMRSTMKATLIPVTPFQRGRSAPACKHCVEAALARCTG